MHKSTVATYELVLNMKKLTIALVQEPWFYKGKPMGLTPHLKAYFHASEHNPRAAIFAPSSLNITNLPHLADKDLAVAIWETDSILPDLQKILLISWYWESNTPLPESIKRPFYMHKLSTWKLFFPLILMLTPHYGEIR
jgi:hypothetical protein